MSSSSPSPHWPSSRRSITLSLEVIERREDGQCGDGDDDDMEEDAECVHAHHTEEGAASVELRGLIETGCQRPERACEAQPAKGLATAIKQRVGDHDDDSDEGKYQLRQDFDVLCAWDHLCGCA